MAAIPALVVGTGFGCRIHVPALRATGFDVVGLVATRPDRLAKKAEESGISAYFTDLDEAITKTGAKIVTVATTPSTHAKLAQTAIARGCHVICEKPFAFDAAEGRALLATAEKAGIVHMVAHEFRWLPERALFGRAISDGLIGDPRFLVIDQFIPLVADAEARMPRWWFDKDAGGGWLGAGGSHLIDQIRVYLGEVESISANLFLVSDRSDVADDSYSCRFKMKSGVEVGMQQTAGSWGDIATLWRCAGTKGTVWIEDGAVKVADKSGIRVLSMPDDLVLPPPPPVDPHPSRRMSHFEIGPFMRLCEAFRDRVEGREVQSKMPAPTFRDGLASMLIMDAMRASAAEGGSLQTLK